MPAPTYQPITDIRPPRIERVVRTERQARIERIVDMVECAGSCIGWALMLSLAGGFLWLVIEVSARLHMAAS